MEDDDKDIEDSSGEEKKRPDLSRLIEGATWECSTDTGTC